MDADEDSISEPTQLAVVSPLTSSAVVLPSVLPVRFTRLLQCPHSHDCRLQTPADTLPNSEHYHMVPVPPITEASPPLRHLSKILPMNIFEPFSIVI